MLNVNEQLKIFELVKFYNRALMNYHPKSYQGNIMFFQAKDRFFRIREVSFGETWTELIKGELILHDISGNHLSMMMSPQVKEIARVLDSFLKMGLC